MIPTCFKHYFFRIIAISKPIKTKLRHITFLKYELKQALKNQAIMLDKLGQMEKYFDQNSSKKGL